MKNEKFISGIKIESWSHKFVLYLKFTCNKLEFPMEQEMNLQYNVRLK